MKTKNTHADWGLFWKGEDSAFRLLSKSKVLTQTDYRIRDYLMTCINSNNKIIINQSYIARELDMFPTEVSRSIRNLIAANVLRKEESSNGLNEYSFNPIYYYCGKLRSGIYQKSKAENLIPEKVPLRIGIKAKKEFDRAI